VAVVQVLIIHSVLIRRKRRIYTARTKPPSSCCARSLPIQAGARAPPPLRRPLFARRQSQIKRTCIIRFDSPALRWSRRSLWRCALRQTASQVDLHCMHTRLFFSFLSSQSNSSLNNSTLFSLFSVYNQSRQSAANESLKFCV
jgi:hypothetical protein